MPLTANGSGVISGTFTIPAGIPAGTKRVRAIGAGGTRATATFTGQGTIETTVLQRVFSTTIWRQWRPPVVVENNTPIGGWTPDPGGGDSGGGGDPLAQTFRLPSGRHVTSVDVKVCAIGSRANPVYCQIRNVQLGIPGPIVLGEGFLDMNPVVANEWTRINFRFPIFLQDNVEYAMVFLTDDNAHSLSIAELGSFDSDLQRWVTANPYSIGVLLSGSNDSTWTPHQGADLTFKLNAARFTSNQRIVDCGDFALANVTDLLVFAGVDIPAPDTSITVLVTREDGTIYRLAPGQPLRFDERVTEDVNISFELNGTELHSPVLFPYVQVVKGEQADTANYVSRAEAAGADSRVIVTFDCITPGSGSSIVVEVGQVGSWTTVAIDSATPLGDGWIERTYMLEGYDLANARVRITLNGTPANRPLVRGLRMLVTGDPIDIIGP